jgi:hypothetical protein
MGKLPSSFRKANRTTRQFRDLYSRLPAHIQELTRDACRLFDKNPNHPSFRIHVLEDNKRGSHLPESVSVSITMQYRAIYFRDDVGINVWYWIGSHADYDRFTGYK